MNSEKININNSRIKNNEIPKKKKKKGFLFWASLSVMLAALIALGIIVAGYLEGCKMYTEISDDVFRDRSELDLASMKVDWEKLLAINSDTVAWIYIPGTNVNYPVVHTTNNDKYLKTTFRGYNSYISWGTIFVDCNNKHDLSDQNITTYGHNMNDGSMFQLFSDMKDSNIFNSHRNIYYLTPVGNYRLKSFSLCHIEASERIIQPNFATKQKMVEYINDKIRRSIVNIDESIPDPEAMTKIFTFSTCDNNTNNYRYMCFAYVAESTVDGVAGLE